MPVVAYTHSLRLTAPAALAVALAVFQLVACKNEEQVQYPQGQSNQAAWSGGAGSAGALGQPSGGAVATAGSAGAQTMGGAGGAAAAPLDAVTLASLKANLDERAKTDAKGMQPTGELFSSQLSEGGTLEGSLLLESKKCYSVLASGGPGVSELDIQITAVPAPNMPAVGPVLAVDNSTGALASITPCYKNEYPLAVFAKIVVKSTRGAGPVAAQAYAK